MMKLTKEQEDKLRELRVEAAKLDHVITSQDFWEVAAEAIRFMSSRKITERSERHGGIP